MAEETNSRSGTLEWKIDMPDDTPNVQMSHAEESTWICIALQVLFMGMASFFQRSWKLLQAFVLGLLLKIHSFVQNSWKKVTSIPKKTIIHCLKVGTAISLVSLLYYMKPLYDGVGESAMWAVITVIVVFEYTVGATLSKGTNRGFGTLFAAALGVAVHWIASQLPTHTYEALIRQASIFILAVAVTYTRFIPKVKARFDYGAVVFILTFTLVSASGYHVEKLIELAVHRLSTIAIGGLICVLISMTIFPVWAGNELQDLITNNMEKLADSIEGCLTDYFRDEDTESPSSEASVKITNGCNAVLNSKATEESLANFARWEPPHGLFNFRHPWQEYLKIGASLRSCAYSVQAINGKTNSDNAKATDWHNKNFGKLCMRLSSSMSAVLRELATVLSTISMESSSINLLVEEMRRAAQELQKAMESSLSSSVKNSNDDGVTAAHVMEIVTLSSLLIEIAERTGKVADSVNGLAKRAGFINVENSDQKDLKQIIVISGKEEDADINNREIFQKVTVFV